MKKEIDKKNIIFLKITKKLLNLSIFTVFNGCLNYFFQFYSAKHLSLFDYKTFNLTMSLSTFFGIPISILTLLIVKESSRLFENNKFSEIFYLYKKTLIYISYFVILSFFTSFLFLNYLKKILDVSDNLILIKIFILHAVGLYFPIILNFIFGLRSYFIYNFLLVFSSLKRILIIFLLVLTASLNFENLITLIICLTIIIVFVSHITFLRKLKKFIHAKIIQKDKSFNIIVKKKELISIALISFFVSSVISLDVIIVSYLYSVEISSNYILASMFGKILFFISASFNTFVLNEAHGLFLKKIKTFNYIFCALTLGFFFYFFSEYLIHILYKDKFILSPEILKIIVFMIFPYSIMLSIEHYLLSINKLYFSKIYFFTLPPIFLCLILFNMNIFQLIFFFAIIGYIFLFFFFIFNYKRLYFS